MIKLECKPHVFKIEKYPDDPRHKGPPRELTLVLFDDGPVSSIKVTITESFWSEATQQLYDRITNSNQSKKYNFKLTLEEIGNE